MTNLTTQELSQRIIDNIIDDSFLTLYLKMDHEEGNYENVVTSISEQLHCEEVGRYLVDLSSGLKEDLERYQINRESK